ncbi:Internalin-A precursor [Gimesia alba]|uniref:Internalin-A n=1 Tax=Gimesia alba TaxID=2527973 RepID=A0A517RID1_9PLAN|nr:hypothetical protein [Gimesia alba]QDT43634.1 Internalin-A precursor [Gimesia alba]
MMTHFTHALGAFAIVGSLCCSSMAENRTDTQSALSPPVSSELLAKIRQVEGQEKYGANNQIIKLMIFNPTNSPDHTLPFLRELKYLEDLFVTNDKNHKEATWMMSIAKLPRLKSLTIDSADVSDKTIHYLAGIKTLQKLTLDVSDVTDVGIESLLGLENLEYLKLRYTPITNVGLAKLTRLPKLKKLWLVNIPITPEGILAFRETKLEEVIWYDEDRPRLAMLPYLKQLPHLWRLDLRSCYVSNRHVEHLQEMSSLEDLDLYGHAITDSGLAGLSKLTKMQYLCLSQAGKNKAKTLSDAGLIHLAGLSELRDLRLAGIQITDSGLRQLAGLTKLRRLDLSGTRVTSAGLANLSHLLQLENLDITSTPLQDEPIVDLRMFPKLKNVTAYGFDEKKIRSPANCSIVTFD